MPLQNFVANAPPTIKAAWLNLIDAFYITLFQGATTAAQARTAIDVPQTNGTGATGTWAVNLTGNVTGNVIGNVTGNVTGSSGSCTGNSATATNATNLTGSGTVSATATGGAGLTPTNATNAVNLTGSGTVSATATGGAGLTPTNATNAAAVPWSGVSGKPTTIAGYGITDVGATVAGLGMTAIGSYIFAYCLGPIANGATSTGANLVYTDTANANGGSVGTGTWTCMGTASLATLGTLWKRTA